MARSKPQGARRNEHAGEQQDRAHGRQVRWIALVLAATMALWMLLSWAGGFYGWPARFAFLIDFLALAAFAWALIVTLRLWRARRK